MSMNHFFLPGEWSGQLRLEGDEARHAKALRIQPGQTVGLLDGRGRIGRATVLAVSRNGIDLNLAGQTSQARPQALAIMAIAFSKAVRRGFFMEKAVELGAHAIWLWQADHSQGHLPADAASACQGQLVAGMKQCANPWLPQVLRLDGIDSLVEHAADADYRILPWEMQDNVPMLTTKLAGRAGLTVYVIGPEGGFSQRELSSMDRAGFVPVSLGARVLRCETAATLTLGLHWWASQQQGMADAMPQASAGPGA